MTAVEYLKRLPHVDPERIGIMGWSHGGYITPCSLFRDSHPFKAGGAIVPVTNLIFRLSYKGPDYQRSFATQRRIGGLPFEKRDIYVERSPLYHVDKLRVPLLVHVATNDDDVNFVEGEQIIDALRAEARSRRDESVRRSGREGGHSFRRRVNRQTLEREDSPEQRDSWNRTWAFLEWNLRPYEDRQRQAVMGVAEEPGGRGRAGFDSGTTRQSRIVDFVDLGRSEWNNRSSMTFSAGELRFIKIVCGTCCAGKRMRRS